MSAASANHPGKPVMSHLYQNHVLDSTRWKPDGRERAMRKEKPDGCERAVMYARAAWRIWIESFRYALPYLAIYMGYYRSIGQPGWS